MQSIENSKSPEAKLITDASDAFDVDGLHRRQLQCVISESVLLAELISSTATRVAARSVRTDDSVNL